MLKLDAGGRLVELKWKERCVEVDGQVAFKQNQAELRGTFFAPFDRSALPP